MGLAVSSINSFSILHKHFTFVSIWTHSNQSKYLQKKKWKLSLEPTAVPQQTPGDSSDIN